MCSVLAMKKVSMKSGRWKEKENNKNKISFLKGSGWWCCFCRERQRWNSWANNPKEQKYRRKNQVKTENKQTQKVNGSPKSSESGALQKSFNKIKFCKVESWPDQVKLPSGTEKTKGTICNLGGIQQWNWKQELSERVALPANDIEKDHTLGNRTEKRAVAASAGSLPVNTECCTIQMTSQRRRRRRRERKRENTFSFQFSSSPSSGYRSLFKYCPNLSLSLTCS